MKGKTKRGCHVKAGRQFSSPLRRAGNYTICQGKNYWKNKTVMIGHPAKNDEEAN